MSTSPRIHAPERFFSTKQRHPLLEVLDRISPPIQPVPAIDAPDNALSRFDTLRTQAVEDNLATRTGTTYQATAERGGEHGSYAHDRTTDDSKTAPKHRRQPGGSGPAGPHEGRNLYDEVADELRNAPGLPNVPLIVLTVLRHDDTQAQLWSAQTLRKINEAKTTLHAQPAASVPHGEHRILDDAGHSRLHGERQDVVLQAINDLLGKTA
ncbi:hypothetical protein [Streptomyces sp. NBC_00057]|uniref:hypothetical protein n=1 Tax=Streptomyces sp. NBC_00057 TaxID=2975634 RepID=UPI003255AF1A